MMGKTSIWARLKAKGFSDTACAAIMGNMQAESALRSNNVEDRCPKTDDDYTAQVDDGRIELSAFEFDAYGYGLCQWTFYERKKDLYNFAKSQGVSIADEQMQIDFMCSELSGAFVSVLEMLQSGVALYIMTRKFMVTFENPADQSESAINYRVGLAQAIFDELAGTETDVPVDESAAASPIASYWPPRTVDKTMQGTDVAVLQSILMARGYYTAGIDSYFGDTTEEAVLAFQKNNGLVQDAIVGKLTWSALLKI